MYQTRAPGIQGSVLTLSPFGPGDVFLALRFRSLLAPLVLDACMGPVWTLVGCMDEVAVLVGGLLGEHWLPLLSPSLEDGAHCGNQLPGDRDANLCGVDAHGAEDPVAAQCVPWLPSEEGGYPAAAACAGPRLPDGS